MGREAKARALRHAGRAGVAVICDWRLKIGYRRLNLETRVRPTKNTKHTKGESGEASEALALWVRRTVSASRFDLVCCVCLVGRTALSHKPAGRASLSLASRDERVPSTSIGSPGRTRPAGFVGRGHGNQTNEASHEPTSRTVAFRPLQRSTSESARKQPEGCGPPGLRFMDHVDGSKAVGAPYEPDGRAALPRSRSLVDAAEQQLRPTIDGFMGRVQVRKKQATSHEPTHPFAPPRRGTGRCDAGRSSAPGRGRGGFRLL